MTGLGLAVARSTLLQKKNEMPQHLATGAADWFAPDHLRAALADNGYTLSGQNILKDVEPVNVSHAGRAGEIAKTSYLTAPRDPPQLM